MKQVFNQAGAKEQYAPSQIGEVVNDMLHSNSRLAEGYRNYQMTRELDGVVAKAAGSAEQKPKSFVVVSQFNQFVEEGLKLAQPYELYKNILVENETTIFFGDTGIGKTTYAMQIAMKISEDGKRVLYVNFELSQQQFAKKYPEKSISDTLFIANIDYTLMHDATDQSQFLREIECQALKYNVDVLVIDNLTNICINAKDGNEAGNVMLRLNILRQTHNWTMLVLAHVPKRKASDPLTLNDVAGSKLLSNFADNVVGFNKSKLGTDKRYIIQLKWRSGPIELDYQHVQEMTLKMSDGYLHFEYGDLDEERIHLPRSRDEKAELERDIVKELKAYNGKSYRDIATDLGTNISMVCRVARQYGLSRGKSDKK